MTILEVNVPVNMIFSVPQVIRPKGKKCSRLAETVLEGFLLEMFEFQNVEEVNDEQTLLFINTVWLDLVNLFIMLQGIVEIVNKFL